MDLDKPNGPALKKPELSIAKDIKEFNPKVINKLNFYKLLLFEYTSKNTLYKELNNWVQSYIEHSWFQLCIDVDRDLYKTIINLKKKVSLSDNIKKERIKKKYQ